MRGRDNWFCRGKCNFISFGGRASGAVSSGNGAQIPFEPISKCSCPRKRTPLLKFKFSPWWTRPTRTSRSSTEASTRASARSKAAGSSGAGRWSLLSDTSSLTAARIAVGCWVHVETPCIRWAERPATTCAGCCASLLVWAWGRFFCACCWENCSGHVQRCGLFNYVDGRARQRTATGVAKARKNRRVWRLLD